MVVFVVIVAISASAMSADDVLARARDQAMSLQTIDYSFTVSHYPQSTLRFRSNGMMTRCDAAVPSQVANGRTVTGAIVYAFNGGIFQRREHIARQLTYGREPLGGGALESGPCWTPLEECYRWLRAVEPNFSWRTIRDPLIWQKLHIDGDAIDGSATDVEDGGISCKILAIRLNNGVRIRVYLSTEHNYFPVRYDVITSSDTLSSSMHATSLKAFVAGESTVWLPKAVTFDQVAYDATHGAQNVVYSIIPETAHVNEGVDTDIFTLEPTDVDIVVDTDTNEFYRPNTTERHRLYDEQPTEQGRVDIVPIPARKGHAGMLVLVNVAVAAVILGSMLWWKRRRRRT